MFVVSGAKIHLFSPTTLYILTIHPYFLTFALFFVFYIMFSLSFVLQSKDFIVFLQKNQTTYQMKKNKKTFYTLLYIVGFISFLMLPLQAFGSIKLDGKHGLIWGYNPSNILCCFDLEKANFSDYFDKENASLLSMNKNNKKK